MIGAIAAPAACAFPGGYTFNETGTGGGGGTPASSSSTASSTTSVTSTTSTTSATSTTSGTGGGSPPATLVNRTFRCKLLSGASPEDPTQNQVQTRFNLKGSGLGIPVISGSTLHLFFGDTEGYKVIWLSGEGPDGIAHLPLAGVTLDPTEVCRSLDFLVTPDDPSVAHGADPAILRDFAGAWMTPPPGVPVSDYIAQPAGPYPDIPGPFEVPTGGLDQGGKVFLFYAGRVAFTPRTRATMSYLARWDAPGSAPNYTIVRTVDALSGGALGGHFIQASPVQRSGSVYLFGTGDYLWSGVYLARLDAGALDTGGGQEIFDPMTSTYKVAASLSQAQREAVKPLFEVDGVGELSVSYIQAADMFVALYHRELHGGGGEIIDNRIVMRVSPAPEGPWSEAVTLIDMADPAFQAQHCCGTDCPGDQIVHCDKTYLYGAYLLPVAKVTTPASGGHDLDLPFLVSTRVPDNVVLFSAQVHVTY